MSLLKELESSIIYTYAENQIFISSCGKTEATDNGNTVKTQGLDVVEPVEKEEEKVGRICY